MIRKIKGSLTAKVCLSTAALLLAVSLLVYAVLAWVTPRTYSNKLNEILEGRTEAFISELEQVPFGDSGRLFDQFLRSEDIVSVELYSGSGENVSYPSGIQDSGPVSESGIVMEAQSGTGDQTPVLSGTYYFSFADSDERFTLVVTGTAAQVTELRRSFVQVFPVLLGACVIIALAASWIYSRMITGPVLEISRISGEIADMHLDWKLDENRTDELGTLEKSLNTLAVRLEQTISELLDANQKLEADMEREKALEQARLDFFAAASHELKTPVTVMKGQLEGMLLAVGVYKDREKYLARSLEVAGTLERMVQEILTISRLETANDCFRQERFDIVPVIMGYFDETEDLIVRKELRVRLEAPDAAWISGNKSLMEKVISNLIGNAVKYSPRGAEVTVSAGEDRGRFTFSVENTGTHIPEDSLPRLFEAFYRVEQSRNRKTGGSGLGLYIVQKSLERHNSVCHVCNTAGGVKFSFTV